MHFYQCYLTPAITELLKTKCLYKMASDSLPDVLMLFFLCSRTYGNLEKSTNMIVLPMVYMYKIYLKYNIHIYDDRCQEYDMRYDMSNLLCTEHTEYLSILL
jgi:hypothetical protein